MAAITRAQFRTAVGTLLDAQVTATPTLLRKTARFRVGMSGEKPIAWQGEITDDIAYDQGTRNRVMTEQVQLATTFPADVLTDDFDDLVDALVARFTTGYNTIADTILELVRIEPNEVVVSGADGDTIYRGLLLNVRLRIWETRI